MENTSDFRSQQRPFKEFSQISKKTPLRRLLSDSPIKVSPRRRENFRKSDNVCSEHLEKPFEASATYSGISETLGGHISLTIILLPSLAAVFSPYVFPGSTSTAELVNFITDGLMIFVVSWFIKFAVEWPWDWLKQIEETKLYLIKDLNSNTSANSLEVSMSEETILKSLLYVRKLQNYESLAYLSCFCGMFLGAVVMVISRNYIIIDESRRSLVFSNFNVALVFFWGSLKLVLSLTARIQKYSILFTKNASLEEMDFVTESNLDLLLTDRLSTTTAWYSPFTRTFVGLALLFSTGSLPRTLSKENTQSQKIGEIQSMILNFHQDVQTYSQHQNQHFSQIKGTLDTISLILSNFGDREFAMSSNPKGNISDQGIYLKPFPLNLSNSSSRRSHTSPSSFVPALPDSSNKSIESATLKPLKTIFENPEDVQDEHQPILLPRNSALQPEQKDPMPETDILFSKHSNIVQAKPIKRRPHTLLPENNQQERQYGQFSLHGIPCSNSVKESIKRHIYHTSPQVNGRIGNHLQDLMGYDGHLTETYELLPLSEDLYNGKVTLMETLQKAMKIFGAHFQNISVFRLVKDPIAITQILYGEALPEVYDAFRPYYRKLQERVQGNKTVLWEISNKYVLRNYHQVALLGIYYLQPLQRAQQFLILIFVRVPINTLRLGASVILFVPKVVLRNFIFKPLILLNEHISDTVWSEGSSTSTRMRNFNLDTAKAPQRTQRVFDPDFPLSKMVVGTLLWLLGQQQNVQQPRPKPVYMQAP